jgi:putative zinc finger/helix-turn-helix YgiT family protein
MKCVSCGKSCKATRGAHKYVESGLSNVTLLNVELRQCPACGEREVIIPHIEELHRVIARTIATSMIQFSAEQVRFLRKWLGFSVQDFALVMGVRPETVSRWEKYTKGGSGYQMPATAERLLRLMVANQAPIDKYPIDLFKTQPRVKPEALKFQAPDWKRAAS